MATLQAPKHRRCLDADELLAIAHCTCSRDELAEYLNHVEVCRGCAGAFKVITLLVANRAWFAEQLALEATS